VLFPIDPLLRFRIVGLPVGIRLSGVLGFLIVTGGVISRLDGGLDPAARRGAWITATICVLLALALAISIHEFVRVRVSRRQGVLVRRIDLYLFGGTHEVIDDTTTPRSEAITALVALGCLALLSTIAAAAAFALRDQSALTSLTTKAIAASLIAITIVQAMPALPLDGGRILRALGWYLSDNPSTGTWAAGAYARVIAVAFIAGGLLMLGQTEERPYWGAGLIIAGMQLLSATRGSAHRSAWQSYSRTLTLGDVSPRHIRHIPATTVIDDVIEQLAGTPDDPALLISDESGALVGVLRLANLKSTRRGDWATATVEEVMTPIAGLSTLSPEMTVFDAFELLDAKGDQIALIADGASPPVALSRTQLLHRLFERSKGRR
jgi:Zn-dependent protease